MEGSLWPVTTYMIEFFPGTDVFVCLPLEHMVLQLLISLTAALSAAIVPAHRVQYVVPLMRLPAQSACNAIANMVLFCHNIA